jgi:hypothetical protein
MITFQSATRKWTIGDTTVRPRCEKRWHYESVTWESDHAGIRETQQTRRSEYSEHSEFGHVNMIENTIRAMLGTLRTPWPYRVPSATREFPRRYV